MSSLVDPEDVERLLGCKFKTEACGPLYPCTRCREVERDALDELPLRLLDLERELKDLEKLMVRAKCAASVRNWPTSAALVRKLAPQRRRLELMVQMSESLSSESIAAIAHADRYKDACWPDCKCSACAG